MGWRKNAFSYLMWFVYTIMAGDVLVGLSWRFCTERGIGIYWGILAVLLFLAGIGGIVCLTHRMAPSFLAAARDNRRIFKLLEIVLAVIFLTVGVMIRLYGMEAAGQPSVYFDAAKVVEGQDIPGMSHGAAYIYVRMLQGVFVLLGNSFIAGIWLQFGLQLMALMFLFFVVRRLAGPVSALVVLGYCTCAPYMVGQALVLSPEMLYFLIFMAAMTVMVNVVDRERNTRLFWLTGALTALCCYLDIAGCLFIFLSIVLLFSHRGEGTDIQRKISAVWRYGAGALLGFLICCLLDASFSGTTVWQVIKTWFLLYCPRDFRQPVIMDVFELGWEAFVLFGLVAFGIFSFWCDRKRDKMSACTLALCSLALVGCFGIFTEEMPGFLYMYLLLVLQAGISVGQMFHVVEQEKTAVRYGWEALIDKIEENEAQREAMLQEKEEEENRVQYIENPLPLPKKHVKRTLDYSLQPSTGKDDFDYPVAEDDDFDI